ncbi:DUF1428 domain-containing protein [Sphingomicrobium arenosum]|uniref:DUF1428 domain-containing protein n=1 Tax=Sphingomicrobium arenosum TaxID=2233861 RepID=UPI002240EDDD|nr:DUF1428 domain-containing protein [Sphingomicrobium arenosum]
MTYVSGFLVPVETGRKEEYIEAAKQAWPLFKDYGAIAQVEAWGDKVPDGKLTDFNRAVALQEGEEVVFSWILWPDKESSERCDASMDTDDRWKKLAMPFDGKRMIYGGFNTIVDERA